MNLPLSRVFCVLCGHFEFLICARCASPRSGAEITEVWDGRENSQILGGNRSLTEDNKVLVIFLELRAGSERFSVISVPDLALAHRARIKNSKWPPQNTKHAR